MLITEIGQLSTPSSAAEIRDQFLRDLALGAIGAGVTNPPVQPGTDWFILAEAVANIGSIIFANQSLAIAAQNILTATGADLVAIRDGLGLPDVPATGSTGTIVIRVFGAATLNSGTQFVLPNGLRGQVTQTYVNPADQSEVNVAAIDTGVSTNLDANQIVRFVSPPANIGTDAKVSLGSPLTGGTDKESPERMRARILDTLRNKPAGGNWAHIREVVLQSLGSVADCYVYPALGGPGSCKVVPVKGFDADHRDFSRALSASALATVRTALQKELPVPQEIVVTASADQPIDATLLVTIPESPLNGGNGSGWTSYPVWPPLVVADNNKVTITAVTSNSQITVSANTTTAPVAGLTYVAWWSKADMRFTTALVVAVGGATGAWVLTLDRSLSSSDGTGAAIGDYISPGARGLDAYGTAWVALLSSLGTGENTVDTNRTPRSNRHPFVGDEDPYAITATTLATWVRQFPEISDHAAGAIPVTTPTVPGSVDTAPNILTPRHFGVYKK